MLDCSKFLNNYYIYIYDRKEMVKYPMDMVIVMSQVSFICPSPSPLLSSWLLCYSVYPQLQRIAWSSAVHKIPQFEFKAVFVMHSL